MTHFLQGIKCGARNWTDIDWTRVQCEMIEVHAPADRMGEVQDIVHGIRKNRAVRFSLHYWDFISGTTWPTFAVEDTNIREQSLRSLMDFIDAAASLNCEWVVFHPGPRQSNVVDRATGNLHLGRQKTQIETARQLLLDGAVFLNERAQRRGVTLIAETETFRKPRQPFREDSTDEAVDAGDLPFSIYPALGKAGVRLCVDTAHVSTWSSPEAASNRPLLHSEVLQFAAECAPYCHYVHLATTLPPHRVDSTNGFSSDELERGVYPNLKEAEDILRTLARSAAAPVVPEPRLRDHERHNAIVSALLSRIEG